MKCPHCGQEISQNEFQSGLCFKCGLLLDFSALTESVWRVYVCTYGHEMHSAQPKERWEGRVCGAVTVQPAPAGVSVWEPEPSSPCEGIYKEKQCLPID